VAAGDSGAPLACRGGQSEAPPNGHSRGRDLTRPARLAGGSQGVAQAVGLRPREWVEADRGSGGSLKTQRAGSGHFFFGFFAGRLDRSPVRPASVHLTGASSPRAACAAHAGATGAAISSIRRWTSLGELLASSWRSPPFEPHWPGLEQRSGGRHGRPVCWHGPDVWFLASDTNRACRPQAWS